MRILIALLLVSGCGLDPDAFSGTYSGSVDTEISPYSGPVSGFSEKTSVGVKTIGESKSSIQMDKLSACDTTGRIQNNKLRIESRNCTGSGGGCDFTWVLSNDSYVELYEATITLKYTGTYTGTCKDGLASGTISMTFVGERTQ